MVLYLFQIIADHAAVPGGSGSINDILDVFSACKISRIVSKDRFIERIIVGCYRSTTGHGFQQGRIGAAYAVPMKIKTGIDLERMNFLRMVVDAPGEHYPRIVLKFLYQVTAMFIVNGTYYQEFLIAVAGMKAIQDHFNIVFGSHTRHQDIVLMLFYTIFLKQAFFFIRMYFCTIGYVFAGNGIFALQV